MKSRLQITFFVLFLLSGGAVDAQFDSISVKINNALKIKTLSDDQKKQILALQKTVRGYKEFYEKEDKLNGKFNIGGTGDLTNLISNHKINAGFEIDYGLYPLEFDLNANYNRIQNQEDVKESILNSELSFDWHPQKGDSLNGNNGLRAEYFGFVSYFNNTFLGIQDRVEAGAGIILNYFSYDHLVKEGAKKKKEIDKLGDYSLNGEDLIVCFNDHCSLFDSLVLTKQEIKDIKNAKYRLYKRNIKEHAKFRGALLIGVYYEWEDALAENMLLFNGRDTTFKIDEFESTNKIRFELRPTLVVNYDRVTLSLYPYFKLPLTNWFDEVRYDDEIVDRRYDAFVDASLNLEFKLTENLSFNANLRYFYDAAPKRIYNLNDNNEPILFIGQKSAVNYNLGMQLRFN